MNQRVYRDSDASRLNAELIGYRVDGVWEVDRSLSIEGKDDVYYAFCDGDYVAAIEGGINPLRVARAIQLHRWLTAYLANLKAAVEANPKEYVVPYERLAASMTRAFTEGTYNKDGRAVRATCKHFKIPHTYAAINGFLGTAWKA